MKTLLEIRNNHDFMDEMQDTTFKFKCYNNEDSIVYFESCTPYFDGKKVRSLVAVFKHSNSDFLNYETAVDLSLKMELISISDSNDSKFEILINRSELV
jgi:hypothetical protein